MKKILSIVMSLMMVLTLASAGAENDAVQLILTTGTTQAFTQEAIPEADIQTIVQAGLKATSAINQQPWYFVVVENADVMAELAGGGMPAGAPAGMIPPAGADDGASSGDAASSGAPAMPVSTGAKAAMGDSPVAIIIYMNEATASPNASFDCGLACQNMVIAASVLGYGTKIISSPTMTLNGANHDALCEKLGVDPVYQAVAVLLVGRTDVQVDGATGASVRGTMEEKVSFIK